MLGQRGVRVRQHQVPQGRFLLRRQSRWTTGAWSVGERETRPMPGQPPFDGTGTDAEELRGFTSGQTRVNGGDEAFTKVR